jgi:alanine racemase
VSRLIRAVIDTQALRNNLAILRKSAPQSRMVAVVKANGYGHGLVTVARALSNADAFAVARIEEAWTLRDAGVKQPIVLLEGVYSPEDLEHVAVQRFEPVVHDMRQIELLERYRGSEGCTLWLKIDTGMNRLGFRVEEAADALARLRKLRVPPAEIRLMTHLARADELDCPMTREQLDRFHGFARNLGLATSIGNSAGILGWPDARSAWVRPGIALYGISPFPDKIGAELGLKPVMTLETCVIALREAKRDETVGYGGIWRADRDSTIAIIAAGYGDGIRRLLPNGTPALVNGVRVPFVGRVSMDMLALDVTAVPQVAPGDRVVLWGPELPVEEIAARLGTIGYEITCGVSQRVPYELR